MKPYTRLDNENQLLAGVFEKSAPDLAGVRPSGTWAHQGSTGTIAFTMGTDGNRFTGTSMRVTPTPVPVIDWTPVSLDCGSVPMARRRT